MRGFNKVILAGNLTRDPEMRYLPTGTAVASFGLAVNRKWKDSQSGEVKEEVTFVDVSVFGKRAEVAAQYLQKGKPILVEGRLKLDQWEDRQTQQKRSKLSVVADGFTFLGDGQGGGGQQRSEYDQERPESGSGHRRPAAQQQQTPADAAPPEDDDVPF